MSRPSSRSSRTSEVSTPASGFYKLPPIITTQADRDFLNEVNTYIDGELSKVNHLDHEQRYIIYKAVFNRVIEHVTAYKPVLTSIKKEYEDTIETIKKGQREAAFLQGKLKAMASEPSTLRNYKKRADELEERIQVVKKDNERLQKELKEILLIKEEREKRPKTAEVPKRQLKKDSRLIPGLTLEETTDMKVLQKKFEVLDRQLKELNISLKARFLPKTHKLQLKETLDNKVAYRDQLLWQSQVYKARGQKLKIALEAAQAYNQMKPPHQTVGDAVTIAFQQASGMLKAEREKAEGEAAEAAQATTFEDDDPNKEKEAEMMLEYIEKFNELFEDGLFEQAAVHAANSPKGILRTQATLAKFRDVKVKTQGRSPLLAFCDAMMSSVKAAGQKPNEALSRDCMEAGLMENRLDLVYHWLAQDRLTMSNGLGQMITEHCSCQLPCKCGCQALAQHVFQRQQAHHDVTLTLLKQGKIQGALQYARQFQSVTPENMCELLCLSSCQELAEGLLEEEIATGKPLLDITLGDVLSALLELGRSQMGGSIVMAMVKPKVHKPDSTSILSGLVNALSRDIKTTEEQWAKIWEALLDAGCDEAVMQLLSATLVVDTVRKAQDILSKEEKRTVSFNTAVIHQDAYEDRAFGDEEESDIESSDGMSSMSRESASFDRSSRETSPDIPIKRSPKASILKKHVPVDHHGSPDGSPRKSPVPVLKKKKRGVRVRTSVSPPPEESDTKVPTPKRELSDLRTAKVGGVKFANDDSDDENHGPVRESEA